MPRTTLFAPVADASEAETERTPLADVRLLAPLVPAAIRDFVAFEEHVEGISASVDGKSEVAPEWYQAPTFYFTNPHTVLGPGETVSPPVTERLDFELEIAVVVGGGGRVRRGEPDAGGCGIPHLRLHDHERLVGPRHPGPRDEGAARARPRARTSERASARGSSRPTSSSRFLDDDGFLAVRAEVFVNGALIGEDLVSNMGWPFPELVAYASRNSRVVPGDVLGSGTVGNGGCLGELWGRDGELAPPPLREGDEVRMVVEGIGELVGRVGAGRRRARAPVALARVPAPGNADAVDTLVENQTKDRLEWT